MRPAPDEAWTASTAISIMAEAVLPDATSTESGALAIAIPDRPGLEKTYEPAGRAASNEPSPAVLTENERPVSTFTKVSGRPATPRPAIDTCPFTMPVVVAADDAAAIAKTKHKPKSFLVIKIESL